MKFHLLVNTGSSLHGIETVEISDDTWQYITDRYNTEAGGLTAAVFANTRIGETLNAAVQESPQYSSDGDVVGWSEEHVNALRALADLNRALTTHHAATLEVERTQ